jgi:hypothetical protein
MKLLKSALSCFFDIVKFPALLLLGSGALDKRSVTYTQAFKTVAINLVFVIKGWEVIGADGNMMSKEMVIFC